MRLIDADKLNEFVYEDAYGCKCVSMYDIDAQPTAYDVDAVEKQISRSAFERYENPGMGGEKVVNLDDVIEIVEGGGVDAD